MRAFVLFLALATPTLAQAQSSDAEFSASMERVRTFAIQGRAFEGLSVLEQAAARTPDLSDPSRYRPLRRGLRQLGIPGADPGWFYAGAPMLVAGAVVTAYIGLFHWLLPYTSQTGDGPLHYGLLYGTAGAIGILGAIFIVVGLVTHTCDPERQAYEQRSDALLLRIRRAILSGRLAVEF